MASLFVYGTLHPDRAPAEIADVVRKLIPAGQGTVRGTLYDLAEYPALVLNAKPQSRIPGTVFDLPNDPETLQSLDVYEQFNPEDPQHSLFLRRKRTVTLTSGQRRRCWVYLYNQPLPLSTSDCLAAATRHPRLQRQRRAT